MIYLGIVKDEGKFKVKAKRQDGTVKTYKATRKVRDYARENFKSGDSFIATFNDSTYVMEKMVKGSPKKYGGGKGGYGKQEMTEISVYKTIGSFIGNLEGVTVKNIEKTIAKLYAQGLELVKGKKAEPSEEATTTESEESTTGEEEETTTGNEEPEE